MFVNTTDSKLTRKEKFTISYQKYYRYVYKVAYGILKSDKYMEDVVQEIYIKIWKNIDTINLDDEDGTKAYISTIARHTAINKYNKDKKNSTQFVDIDNDIMYAVVGDASGDPSEIVVNDENVNYIYDKIKELGDKYSRVMMLKYQNEHTPEEIAEITELNIKTVYTKLSRGRELLKAKLFKERGKNSEKTDGQK